MNETYIPGFSYALRGAPVRRLAVGGRAGRRFREDTDFDAYGADQYYQPTPQPVQVAPSGVQVAAAPTAAPLPTLDALQFAYPETPPYVDPDLGYTPALQANPTAQHAQTAPYVASRLAAQRDVINPNYSAETKTYLQQLNNYIQEQSKPLSSDISGRYYSTIPTTVYEPLELFDYRGNQPSPAETKYLSERGFIPADESALQQYIGRPLEENIAYSTHLLNNSGDQAGTLNARYNTPVVLVNDATGEVIYSGTGLSAAQEAAKKAQELSSSLGKNAEWSVYTGPAGSTDLSQFNRIAQETKDKSILGTIADIALPVLGSILLPGVGGLAGALGSVGSAAAGSALGSALSGTLQGRDIGDILKGAALSAATAGLVKAPILGGGQSISGALGGALQGAGNVAGNVAGQAAGDAAGDIIVTGLSKAAEAGGTALAGGALNALLGNTMLNTPFDQAVNQPVAQQPTTPPATFEEAFGPGWEVLANTSNVPANAVAGGALDTILNNSLMNTPIEEVPQQPQQPDQTVDDGIVVRGDTGGALELPVIPAIPTTPPPPPVEPPSGLANEIVVEAQKPAEPELPVIPAIPTTPPPPVEPPSGLANEIVVEAQKPAEPELPVVPPVVPPVSGYDPVTNTITAVAEPSKPITDAETKIDAVVPPITSVDIPANAGDVTPKDDKGLSVADYIRLASLGISTIGKLFEGSGTPSGGRYSGGTGALNPIFSAQLPGANMPGLTAGTSGARPAAQSGLNTTQDWYRYGYGPEQSFFNYVPMAQPNTSQAYTGYAQGGFAVEGPGDGRDDKIPAMLSDGEYVIDAETVALLGNGSNKAGADLLDKFRVNVRKHKGQQLAKGEFSNDAKRPEHYMAGGRM